MQARHDAQTRIIRLLKTGDGWLSGESISGSMGISRSAVWKHIKNLRGMGYDIKAAASKGYRLVHEGPAAFNAVEVTSTLSTALIGKKVFFHDSLVSTNLKAYELAVSGEPEGTAVIADAQTGGKGRMGRRWESPKGVNLYTSIILRPSIPPGQAHELTFVAAVAVAEAVAAFVPKRPSVKWPNDVLIGGRKTAGILMEMNAEPDRVHFVVAGIGVNINMSEAMFPEELRRTATSMTEVCGRPLDRAEVTRVLYSSVEKWYKVYLTKGLKPIMDAWKGFFEAEGRRIKVNCFNRTIEGTCLGLDPEGALLVRTSSGVERIISGDMDPVV